MYQELELQHIFLWDAMKLTTEFFFFFLILTKMTKEQKTILYKPFRESIHP